MIHRILCPVDGSRHSDRALSVASDLAARYRAKLTVVHVPSGELGDSEGLREFARHEGLSRVGGEPWIPASGSASELVASAVVESRIETETVETAARIGEKLLQDARLRVPEGVEVETALLQGDTAECIVQAASDRDVDLIVMGRCGAGDSKDGELGSVSSKVSKESRGSCMVVR